MLISKPFTDYTAADYALVVDVNLTGFFWLTQRVIAEMATRYGGHVISVLAAPTEVANCGTPTVLAALTNGGLAAATRSLAIEYAAYGIRVNAVSLDVIQTPVHPPEATRISAADCPRSAGPARSATSRTACCSWSRRPTSPVRSCTSTAARSPATEAPRLGRLAVLPEPRQRGSQLAAGADAELDEDLA
jgi:NAD(P)-dependent dehydrogenase (short-subunit alcohol dehydrogenase family)